MANNGYTTEIVYPYTDEMAMDDGIYQVPIYLDVTGSFRVLFSKVPRSRVHGNTFIYFTEGNPLHRVAPDCWVLFDLSDEGEASNQAAQHLPVVGGGQAPRIRNGDRLA